MHNFYVYRDGNGCYSVRWNGGPRDGQEFCFFMTWAGLRSKIPSLPVDPPGSRVYGKVAQFTVRATDPFVTGAQS